MDNAPGRSLSSSLGKEKNWIPILASSGLALKMAEENKRAEAEALAEMPIKCLLSMATLNLKVEWQNRFLKLI